MAGPLLLGPGWTSAARADIAVRVQDNEYSPAATTIEVGETVTWAWTGANPHSVAGGPWGTSHPGCSPLTTGACGSSGSTFSWTASAQDVGAINYSCQVHGGAMTGRIEVVEAGSRPSASPTPSESPSASPSPTASPSVSPTPSPSESASSSPSPSPSPSPTFGPPPPRPTAPPVAVEPTESEDPVNTPAPAVTLEAFPAPVDPESVTDSPTPQASSSETPTSLDDAVPVVVPRVVAAGLFATTLLAMLQLVVFGPPWPGRDDRFGDG